jgi:hypothetical protein
LCPLITTLLLCGAPAAAFAQPAASLSTWQSSNGTGVRFTQLTPEVVEDLSTLELPYETSDGAYKYAVDTSALSWRPDCTCYRYYVIFARSRANGVLTRHKFKGIPSGSFPDQRAPVRLSIEDAAGTHTDDIALPVASAPGLEPVPILDIKTDRTLWPVSLGGVTDIQITLSNSSPDDTVEIRDVVLATDAAKVWKTAPSLPDAKLSFTLTPKNSRTLTVRLEPAVKHAIGISFPPTSPDLSHTTLRLEVPYSSQMFAGRDGEAVLVIPLRFKPGVIALGLWLLGGVVIGSLVPLLSGKKGSTLKKWPRILATALVVGIVLEVFGILLVQNKSKLVLFGFDIDPWQTTPVMVLGIVTGLLGLQAAKLIEDRMKKDVPTPATTS